MLPWLPPARLHTLSPSLHRQASALFSHFDPDNDGAIDTHEMRKAIRQLQHAADEAATATGDANRDLHQARQQAAAMREMVFSVLQDFSTEEEEGSPCGSSEEGEEGRGMDSIRESADEGVEQRMSSKREHNEKLADVQLD